MRRWTKWESTVNDILYASTQWQNLLMEIGFWAPITGNRAGNCHNVEVLISCWKYTEWICTYSNFHTEIIKKKLNYTERRCWKPKKKFAQTVNSDIPIPVTVKCVNACSYVISGSKSTKWRYVDSKFFTEFNKINHTVLRCETPDIFIL